MPWKHSMLCDLALQRAHMCSDLIGFCRRCGRKSGAETCQRCEVGGGRGASQEFRMLCGSLHRHVAFSCIDMTWFAIGFTFCLDAQ